uniref:RIIa domain-containing protein n=1 Tax=Graphocephala atropunctata TaxID=36148 RepID=A0A1B6LLY3_9HEMI
MNYTLQLHGERILYQVPPGLYELMSDISREVLRDQPGLLYQYIAHYLETLIKVRDCSKVAEEVVVNSLDENLEILAYIDSLGTTWEAANSAARKIQGAARRFRSKKELQLKLKFQQEKKAATEFYLESRDFQDFVETLHVDFDSPNRASSILLDAYKEFIGREEKGEELRSEASIHTIESISPIVSGVVSKQLVKEEEGERKCNSIRPYTLNYEGEVDVNSEETEALPSLAKGLPGYQDEEPKVPMIAQTGELEEDKEIITLFSVDSVDKKYFAGSNAGVITSFSNVTLPSLGVEKSKELFEILEGKYSEASHEIPTRDTIQIEIQMPEEDRGSRTTINRKSTNSDKVKSEQGLGEVQDSRTSIKSRSKTSSKTKSVQIEVAEEGHDSRPSIKSASKTSSKMKSVQIEIAEEGHSSRPSIKSGSKTSSMMKSVQIEAPDESHGSRSSMK